MKRCLKGSFWAFGSTLVALVLVGCGGSETQSSVASNAPASVSVPADALLRPGQITFCADLSGPPLGFLDAAQKPVGVEVELGDAMAAAMGVKAVWANTAFSGIIPALQAKQCDAILSQLFIKPEREKVVDFVPYMYSSNTVLVSASTTDVTGPDALCGKKVAAQTGTTIADFLKEAGTTCTGGGQPGIDVRLFAKDTDALQQLRLGLVNAYGTTLEAAGYAMKLQQGVFKTAGEPFGKIECGIATRKDNAGLNTAIKAALRSVQTDGTYDAVLKTWNLSGDALKAG